jgi:ABC-2 type transport system permease protein
MNFARVKAVARKEGLHILRDPRSLVMAILLPFLMILLFGYGLTLDVDRIPTSIYDADNSAESRAIISRFEGSHYFRIVDVAGDYGHIQDSINRGRAMFGLVIPRQYSRDLLAGKEPQIQILLDGSDSNTASIALSYARTLFGESAEDIASGALNRSSGVKETPSIEARIRIWYNSGMRSQNFIIPGLIAIILMIIATLLTSLTISREWESGTMEQLLSTPLRPAELILGKMSAYFILGALDTVLVIIAGVAVFHVPFRGSLLFLALTSGIFLTGVLCWGILLSTIAKSQLLSYQLGALTSFLPAILLSGFIFSIENMPPAIQTLSYLIPSRYFVTILKGIFLRGIGIEVLWVEVGLLLVFAVIVFLLARNRLRREGV